MRYKKMRNLKFSALRTEKQQYYISENIHICQQVIFRYICSDTTFRIEKYH